MMIFQTHLEGSGSLTASKGAALSEAEALVVTGKSHGNRVVSLNQPIQNSNEYCQCQNYRTEVEEYEGTVIYRTLLFYNSVFLGRYEKKTYLNLLLTFFRCSIILVGALLFYNSVFPHFSHISHFRSIISFLRSIIHFFRRTEKLIIERKN